MTIPPRSFLFVPGNRQERFAKAVNSGSDTVILDLEDAVPVELKDKARQLVKDWLVAHSEVMVTIRVNSRKKEWFQADVALAKLANVTAIVLSKTETLEDVKVVHEIANGDVYAIIETPLGLANARVIAKASGLKALMFGSLDFQLEMGMQGGYEELLYFRNELVLASKLANIEAPIDGVTVDFRNQELLQLETEQARKLGFQGKLCIHPNQVTLVNKLFISSEIDISWAKQVLEVVRQAQGQAVSLDGKMIDKPVITRATNILIKAGLHNKLIN